MGQGGLTPIRRLMKEGKRFYTKNICSYYIKKTEESGGFFFTVVAAKKKTSKKAVVRNRVRRRCREAVRLETANFLCKKNMLIEWVMQGNKGVIDATWESLLAEVKEHREKVYGEIESEPKVCE